jgi:TRAP-type C4-dicarboxylate transport system substrate-binding protein
MPKQSERRHMRLAKRGIGEGGDFARAAAFRAGSALLLCALLICRAQAQDKTYLMKITLPTLNDAVHQAAKNYGAAVEKDSGGRIKVEIYPASQLGAIPRQIEGVQFGAIQGAFISPEFFVGLDKRFEVMTTPGLVDSLEHGERLAADPKVLQLMLGLGENKGLHGVGMFMAASSSIISRSAIRHLDDFKGKKIRILASEFQSTAMQRLGAAPVAMTLADVLPAIQQGTIDGAMATVTVFVPMHYADTAKYVTETNQSAIFTLIEISQNWYNTLPNDLQQIVDGNGAIASKAIGPWAIGFETQMRKAWQDQGGELISLPPDEQSSMVRTLASVGQEVSKANPTLYEAYEIVADAARRTRPAPSQ